MRYARTVTLIFCFLWTSCFPSFSQPPASSSDEELLETIERQSFEYFLMERNPQTGLVRDRAHNFQKGAISAPASIAATGFALTAYGVAVDRGWLDRATGRQMVRQTLEFFLQGVPQEHGFFYHFLDMETGKRANRSELSPIDTALFLAGALFAAAYFEDPEIEDLAKKIYERVDFTWMLNGGETLALAWSPEQGFNKRRWDHYDESMILYLLGIGSPTHPVPPSSWQAIARPVGSYQGYRVIQMPPLFTHQYSHIWIDFRDKNDGFADYFKNSVDASLANRAFVMHEAPRFSGYGPNAWGLTASDGPYGYRAYGAPPGWAEHDGTLAPTGCGGSIVFTPKESIACLRHFYDDYKDKLWGLYGFSDAFNLDKDWFDDQAIGIDQGALMLMIENYRSGLIWKVMARNTNLQDAMNKVGFKPGTKDLPWPDAPQYKAAYVPEGIQVDGFLIDWPSGVPVITLDRSFKEHGAIQDDKDLKGEIRFAWDSKALYFFVQINDTDLVLRKIRGNLWQDDSLEIFIDPEGNGLKWNSSGDFQIGFRPRKDEIEAVTWSWFQGGEDPSENKSVIARGFVDSTGYVMEGSIRWDYLNKKPEAGSEIRLSVALHDIDSDRSEAKTHWFFRNEEDYMRFALGRVILEKQ